VAAQPARPAPGAGPARRAGRTYWARAATEAELERYWPQLLRVWPAYERFYEQGGRRSVYVLDPTGVEPQSAEQLTP
jgi:hypothetical protein